MSNNIPVLMEKAMAEVDRVRQDLVEGKLSQAGDLGPRVDALMKAVQQLPKAEAKVYLDSLDDLQNSLGALADEYRNLAEATKGGLNRINTVSQASTAYARRGAELGAGHTVMSGGDIIDVAVDDK